ncbi:MAG: tetratricopeptide repeat protein, partial [Candidatus Coatesbacteria bacterium]
PLLGVVFAGVAVGAITLFGALRRRPLRLAAVAVAAATALYAVASEWPHQRRDPRFLDYYGRKIVEPVGYEAIYVSAATTSNFLYWLRQYTFGQRLDVELYNINDERFDIDKLAGLLWRSLGARPVFVDYFFLNQTHQRRAFSRQGRPAGFILELTDRPTGPEEAWPLDAEVLARAEEALAATDFAPDRPMNGADLALSVWQYHGTYYELRGEAERAGYFFRHGPEAAPGTTMPHLNLARWYYERGEYARAREAARRALAAKSGAYMWYMAHAYLAMADQAEGDLAAAEYHARRAVALKPHDGKTHRLLAGVYLEQGDLERARGELELTVDAGYNDPDAVMMLAQIYRQEGREEEAFALLAENVHDFNDVRLMNMYAVALVERGRYVEARAELERALRIDPTSREVRANLARLERMGW